MARRGQFRMECDKHGAKQKIEYTDSNGNAAIRYKCKYCYSEWKKLKKINTEQSTSYQLNKNYKYKSLYGVTAEDVANMVIAQNGRCAICSNKADDKLCVDHDHVTGKVRGLLCRKCNIGIGMLGDSTDLLLSAHEYLKKFRG